jgi:hypothetical protein
MSTIHARLASGGTLALTAASYNEFKASLTSQFQAGRRSVSALAFNYADYNAAQKAILTGLIHKSWTHICHVFGNSTSETNARIQRTEDFTENNHLMREWAGRFPGLSVADGSLIFAIGLTDCPSVLAASIRLLHLTDWPTKWAVTFQSNTAFKWATFDAISKGQRGLETARPYVAATPASPLPVIVPPRTITPPAPPSHAIQMPALIAPALTPVPAAAPTVEDSSEQGTQAESEQTARLPRRTRCARCNELPSMVTFPDNTFGLSCDTLSCSTTNNVRRMPSQREAIMAWNSDQRRTPSDSAVADVIAEMVDSVQGLEGADEFIAEIQGGLRGDARPVAPSGAFADEGTPVLDNNEEEV